MYQAIHAIFPSAAVAANTLLTVWHPMQTTTATSHLEQQNKQIQ
jgi:hypothetical protein